MSDDLTHREKLDAAAIAGEMAASRLYDLVQERFLELKEQGETQADVARRLGATPQQVGNWLVEPRNMTIRSAGRLLSALKAHLVFELERYEDLTAGNAPSAQPAQPVPTITINDPGKTVYLVPQGQWLFESVSK